MRQRASFDLKVGNREVEITTNKPTDLILFAILDELKEMNIRLAIIEKQQKV